MACGRMVAVHLARRLMPIAAGSVFRLAIIAGSRGSGVGAGGEQDTYLLRLQHQRLRACQANGICNYCEAATDASVGQNCDSKCMYVHRYTADPRSPSKQLVPICLRSCGTHSQTMMSLW
ncbi:hypothetical protein BS78_03G033200 [Paspalum vaginatum]|nr:hypothetical protein BS78_03G033200 [Paspalum vaginatum]